VVKEIAFRHEKSFGSFRAAVDVAFSVSDDKLWRDRGLERHLAPAACLDSPVIIS